MEVRKKPMHLGLGPSSAHNRRPRLTGVVIGRNSAQESGAGNYLPGEGSILAEEVILYGGEVLRGT